MKRSFLATIIATSLTLGGCASWYPETKADRPDDAPNSAMLKQAKAEADRKAAQDSAFQTTDAWIVGSNVKEYQKYPILQDKHVEVSQYNRTLPDMVSRLSEVSGVNVFLASDLYTTPDGEIAEGEQGNGQGGFPELDSTAPDPAGTEVDTSNVMTLLGGSNKKAVGRFANPLETDLSFSVEGSASDLFDTIASQLGISWKYNEAKNRVTFHRMARENFQVYFPGESTTSIATGGGNENESVMSQESEYELVGGD